MRIQLTLEFMCTDKNNDRSKTQLPPHPPSSFPVTVFLIAKKLVSL